jgi:hypothetical protein
MGIYDRSKWPSPEANPLVLMLRRGDHWYSNAEILAALGVGTLNRSLVSQWPTLLDQIGANETTVQRRGWYEEAPTAQPRGGGQERYYSRKALVIIGMRAQTPNAAAFRDWLAENASDVDWGPAAVL